MPIKVIIADDHPVTRKGLVSFLDQSPDVEVLSETADGLSTVKAAKDLHPDIVIMDISMPDINGIEATRRIKSLDPGIGIIGLSIHMHKHYIFEMLKAGGKGYLSKSCDEEEILNAIHSVYKGKFYLTPGASANIAEDLLEATSGQGLANKDLTHREIDVLRLLAKGRTVNEIASELSISAKTVETHRANVSAKLKLKTIPELAVYAERVGLLKD